MNSTRIAKLAVVLTATVVGCGDGELPPVPVAPDAAVDPTIIAGVRARQLGVAHYRLRDRDDVLRIRLHGEADDLIGELTIAPVSDARDVARDHFYDRVIHYETAHADRELMRVAADIAVYLDDINVPWQAALSDLRLAPVFAERALEFRVGEAPDALSPGVTAFSGEFPCCGHRTGADIHAAGSPYLGCGGDCSTTYPQWNMGLTGTCVQWVHGNERICDAACCNGSCTTPSPGPSPCGEPYGAGGCYVTEHWDYHFCATIGWQCEPECQPLFP